MAAPYGRPGPKRPTKAPGNKKPAPGRVGPSGRPVPPVRPPMQTAPIGRPVVPKKKKKKGAFQQVLSSMRNTPGYESRFMRFGS